MKMEHIFFILMMALRDYMIIKFINNKKKEHFIRYYIGGNYGKNISI